MSLWKFNIMASMQEVLNVLKQLVGPHELFEQFNQALPDTGRDQLAKQASDTPAAHPRLRMSP